MATPRIRARAGFNPTLVHLHNAPLGLKTGQTKGPILNPVTFASGGSVS
jgi:hypothetical protein